MRMTGLGINWKGYIAVSVSADTTIDLCSRCAAYSSLNTIISARQDVVSYDKEPQHALNQTSKYLRATGCTQRI